MPVIKTNGVIKTAAIENLIVLKIVGFNSRTTSLPRTWPNTHEKAVASASETGMRFIVSPNDLLKLHGGGTN